MTAQLICQGISVVEAGAGSLPASLIGMMLADNGANVLKLEPPEGDRLRADSPNGFLVWNRGKSSRVVDLRTPAGQETARTLIGDADVFLDGFGTGVTDRWRLGQEVLRTRNPALVYCAVRGFASTGPYASLPAYEGIVAAKSGLYSRGQFAYRPGPVFLNFPLASHGAAHMGLAGILSALLARDRTGTGQYVETSMWQGLAAFDYFGTLRYQVNEKLAAGSRSVQSLPLVKASRQGLMVCSADGKWISLSTMLPHQARTLMRVCGLGALTADSRFAGAPVFDSAEDADEFENLIWQAVRDLTAQEFMDRVLTEPDLACEVCGTTQEAFAHPQVVHNGHAVTVQDPKLGPVRQVGPIGRFERTPSRITAPAPALGELRECCPALPQTALPQTALPHAADQALAVRYPLEGVTILEFGYFVAMPAALVHAAALGARVIKIENAKPVPFQGTVVRGDPTRWNFGIAEVSSKMMQGKESIAIDLGHPEGQAIVTELVKRADAFVCGFRPGIAENFGLGNQALRQLNERLVYLHAAGYGYDGPRAQRAAYAQTAAALTGEFDRQSGVWLDPELSAGMNVMEIQAVLKPRILNIVDADGYAALGVLSALMLALFHQQRTGQGQFVSTTMINSNLYAVSDDFVAYEGKAPVLRPDPEQYGLHALYRNYEARDGWLFVAALTDRAWTGLTAAIGRPDLAADPRFGSRSARHSHDAELVDILTASFAERKADEWETSLLASDVPCVAVNPLPVPAWTATDPGLRESGLTFDVQHPVFGTVRREGLPVRMSDAPGRVAAACLAGQHTEAILRELGHTSSKIEDLEKKGIAFASGPHGIPDK